MHNFIWIRLVAFDHVGLWNKESVTTTTDSHPKNIQKTSHWHKALILKLPVMFVCLMVFNTTFNNLSVISWQSVLLVDETGGPGENHRPLASHWQALSHNVVHLARSRFELTTSVVIGSDCIGRCNPTTIRSRPRGPHSSYVFEHLPVKTLFSCSLQKLSDVVL